MDSHKTIFDYVKQTFLIFGATILLLNIFCLAFGDAAEAYSTMFALGSRGLPVCTVFQFFAAAVLITLLRALFFTDYVIKKMALSLRTAAMVGSVLLVIVLCVCLFGWFPVAMWQAWLAFFICFGICFAASTAISSYAEKTENKKMEDALKKLQERT